MIDINSIIDSTYTDNVETVKTALVQLNRASELLATMGVNLSAYVELEDLKTQIQNQLNGTQN